MSKRKLNLENWQEEYEKKVVSLEEAVKVIKSGDNVFIPNMYMGLLPGAIVERKDELKNVTVEIQAPLNDPGWLSEGMEDSFKVITRIYLGPIGREPHDEGRIAFIPYTNGTWFKPYRDNRPMTRDIDVLLLDVAPPDENGFLNFGANLWERRHYTERAKIIIAELNPNKIRAHGDTAIHVSEVDYLADLSGGEALTQEELDQLFSKLPPEVHEEVQERINIENPNRIRNLISILDDLDPEVIITYFGVEEPGEEVKAMAGHLKTIIRDRDTIQIGMGRPSKFLVELGVFDGFKDLSIFSEMSCPGMLDLIRRGIATGKYATLHPGKAVFTGLNGSNREEVLWADNNPLIELRSSDYVVNIANISRNENMVAINNAIQIDLIGQITCETQFGTRLINGPGGQIEFHIGAFSAPGGRAVTLLPSTWGEGSVSNIVPYLDQGAMVSIPRSFADIVITEWGVAQLAGKTHRERAEELIRIAHPDFRAELTEAAQAIF